ncbi:MAG: RNA-guided endonuclease TnpB family protein [Microcoleaceae cyanobacterium]
MKQRFKYRSYPTDEQKVSLSKLFGCTRVVGNDAVNRCIDAYVEDGQKPSNSLLQKELITQAKLTQEREGLSEVSVVPLQQSLNDLNRAYQIFLNSCQGKRTGERVKSPRFKSKKSRPSARFTLRGFKVNQHNLYLAKIGIVKMNWSRKLPDEPTIVTLIKDTASRYFVSFVVEINPTLLPKRDKSWRIDLGMIDFATFDDGTKVKAAKSLKKRLKRLSKLQRHCEVARIKVAILHAKIQDTRTDFLPQLSTTVIQEKKLIALEDLNVTGIMKNRKLSRAISDLGWRSFRTMLEAKAEIYDLYFRVIDRWEPRSQKCSCCGKKGGKKELSIREWTCLFCGAEHDRDVNTSKNILNVAGRHSQTNNGRGGRCKTIDIVTVSNETSTTLPISRRGGCQVPYYFLIKIFNTINQLESSKIGQS